MALTDDHFHRISSARPFHSENFASSVQDHRLARHRVSKELTRAHTHAIARKDHP